MKRYGLLFGVKPERYEEYKNYHAHIWPELVELDRQCNIRNKTLFHYQGMLFIYEEYVGQDYAADMAKRDADPRHKEWMKLMQPMMNPPAGHEASEWIKLEEIMHLDLGAPASGTGRHGK